MPIADGNSDSLTDEHSSKRSGLRAKVSLYCHITSQAGLPGAVSAQAGQQGKRQVASAKATPITYGMRASVGLRFPIVFHVASRLHGIRHAKEAAHEVEGGFDSGRDPGGGNDPSIVDKLFAPS